MCKIPIMNNGHVLGPTSNISHFKIFINCGNSPK